MPIIGQRAHLITGGFPPGSSGGHDMAYARLKLLELLYEGSRWSTTVANDFSDIERWLDRTDLLITYVAGPYPDETQNDQIRSWIREGGRWLGLHGTSGGRAARIEGDGRRRTMVKTAHHQTLGCFFLNHPPLRRFRVEVSDRAHALTRGLPASFEVTDELYLVELQDPASCEILLTTELPEDPSPPGFGFEYEQDTALQPDGKTRVLGYTRALGSGGVAYIALGHCHSPRTNLQPLVDKSAAAGGEVPRVFHGPWENETFGLLLRNSLDWGAGADRAGTALP